MVISFWEVLFYLSKIIVNFEYKIFVMATTSNIYLPLSTTQIFDLVKQLPIKEKTTLLHLLENNIADNDAIPNWQIELGKKEVENIANNNTVLMEWTEAKKQMKL